MSVHHFSKENDFLADFDEVDVAETINTAFVAEVDNSHNIENSNQKPDTRLGKSKCSINDPPFEQKEKCRVIFFPHRKRR